MIKTSYYSTIESFRVLTKMAIMLSCIDRDTNREKNNTMDTSVRVIWFATWVGGGGGGGGRGMAQCDQLLNHR